jgi:thermitase
MSNEIKPCDCGGPECMGPEPVPWLSWKHCFHFYELRQGVVPIGNETGIAGRERLIIRVKYDHELCLLGRKQGPIVHSLTLLPIEVLRVYEFDRYRRSTSATTRFSVRTSFFDMTQKVADAYHSSKADAGGSMSASSSAHSEGGGGVNLGIISIGGGSSSSSNSKTSAYFDVANVSSSFSHVAHTSSLAVESERSIVVSTFEESESGQSTARTLRNDNLCHAVTYYIRRVFEVYELSTKIVGIEIRIGDEWIEVEALPDAIKKAIRDYLKKIEIGSRHTPGVEIALPTDGLLYEAELAHCCSCDCESQVQLELEQERLRIENLNLSLEAERRQKLLDAGKLDPFEPAPPPAGP